MLFNSNEYELYNKHTKILSFIIDRSNEGVVSIRTRNVFSTLLPFGVKQDFSNLELWITNRRAPQNRRHIKDILDKCNCNDIEGYIRFTYAASLNDTFWIKPVDRNISWEEVSLYQNPFDENIARIAFDGGLMGEKMSSATPELGTDGTFAKCWIRMNNDIFLLKRGSTGASNAGREPYSEVYASELAEKICTNSVKYEILTYHNKLASKCRLFTDENISYSPLLFQVGDRATFDEIFKFYDSIDSSEQFREMMVLDALTLNTDRHLKNYGILYDSDTMQIKGMAPVFDNNLSLCPYASEEDLLNLDTYLPTRSCALNDGFNEIAIKCMTPSIKSNLKNLKGFEFSPQKYHLPQKRLKLLERMVDKQIDNILHQKTITIHQEENSVISLDSFSITFDYNSLNEEAKEILENEEFTIPPFSIISKNNEELTVYDCKTTVIQYNEKLEIDVFDTEIKGKLTTNIVKEIKGFNIVDLQIDKEILLKPLYIELQISIGNNSFTSLIKDVNITLKNRNNPISNDKITTKLPPMGNPSNSINAARIKKMQENSENNGLSEPNYDVSNKDGNGAI